jgi:hypothetical protein
MVYLAVVSFFRVTTSNCSVETARRKGEVMIEIAYESLCAIVVWGSIMLISGLLSSIGGPFGS